MANSRGFTSDKECDEILNGIASGDKSGYIREAVKSYVRGAGRKWLKK